MNPIDRIFPQSELSTTEQSLLVEIFSNPVVMKYLALLGTNASKDLLTLSALTETPDSLTRKYTLVAGKLEVLTTLLSLKEYKDELH